MYKINHADIKEWAKNYNGEPFDAILCDPPYELGFMGKSWDSSGIAFDVEMWKDLLHNQDCLNGLQHSIAEIDQDILRATPATRRKMYRGEAWKVIDGLLDRRNELTSMMSELIMDEYTELMEGESM